MMLRKTNLFNCNCICLEMLFAKIYGSVNWLKTFLGDLLTFRFQGFMIISTIFFMWLIRQISIWQTESQMD